MITRDQGGTTTLPGTDNALVNLEHASDDELHSVGHQHRSIREAALEDGAMPARTTRAENVGESPPMSFTLTGTNLDAPDAAGLAGFYRRLLGWAVKVEEPGWVVLQSPDGGHTLNFQTEARYVRPVWPAVPGSPPMMMHLEVKVDDLRAAVTQAVALGATVADFQPQEDVRVCLDPAGHPFCLYTED